MAEGIPLPHDYLPFKTLVVCSNTLTNGRVPISMSGVPVFLIGKGPEPLIWLNALTSTGWQPLVRASRPLHEQVNVLSPEPRTWVVSINSEIVIKAFVEAEDKAEITNINFLPLGLNIRGNQLGLNLGTQLFHGNQFKNVETMIAIGPRKESTST